MLQAAPGVSFSDAAFPFLFLPDAASAAAASCWNLKSSIKSQTKLWFCWKTRDGDGWPGAEGKK